MPICVTPENVSLLVAQEEGKILEGELINYSFVVTGILFLLPQGKPLDCLVEVDGDTNLIRTRRLTADESISTIVLVGPNDPEELKKNLGAEGMRIDGVWLEAV